MAMLSLEEAANRLGITADQLRSKAKSGEIRALHDGGKLLFREEDLAKLQPAPDNPLKPDFELDFGSDSGIIPDASPVHTDPSDQALVPSLDAKHDSSLEFSLIPDESSDVESEPSFVLDMPENVNIKETPKAELKPDSSGIIAFQEPEEKKGDSSSDFLLDAQGGSSGSSGEFVAAISDEMANVDPSATFVQGSEPEGGDLFELGDSNPDQTIAYNPAPQDDSSSEFDLELAPGDPLSDSESASEFDLSLEPRTEGPSDSAVFETDFSSLGESDSSSEIVAIDGIDSASDLSGSEDGTGSEVVPLDEDVPEGEVTTRGVDNLDVDGLGDFTPSDEDGLVPVEMGEEGAAVMAGAAAAGAVAAAGMGGGSGPEAPWGVMPALVLIPSAIVLFLMGIVSVEMVRTVWAYNHGMAPTRPVIKALSELIGNKIPD